jgi:predicted dinucleotide-binding enzyme
MTTAIIGVGNIGGRAARQLVAGGERVTVASRGDAEASRVAQDLGEGARSATIREAIEGANAVLLAVPFEGIVEVIAQYAGLFDGKVVIDPSNPITPDGKGGFARTLPDGRSSGSVIAGLLPKGAHFVKAFGTLAAPSLGTGAHRTPDPAVLFYATDDAIAEDVVRRLIVAAGFEPVKAGGVKDVLRIEVGGDLHQFGGLNGKLLNVEEARAAVAAGAVV